MTKIIQTTREWWLVTLCVVLFAIQVLPQSVEWVYPVIDTQGSNMLNMQVEKKVYRCGDTPKVYFLFQKQRNVAGQIKWRLVPNKPNAEVYNYKSRMVASPSGITANWAPVEELPENCQTGSYHFEGTITYPLLWGHTTYPLRTTCFEIVEGKK